MKVFMQCNILGKASLQFPPRSCKEHLLRQTSFSSQEMMSLNHCQVIYSLNLHFNEIIGMKTSL